MDIWEIDVDKKINDPVKVWQKLCCLFSKRGLSEEKYIQTTIPTYFYSYSRNTPDFNLIRNHGTNYNNGCTVNGTPPLTKTIFTNSITMDYPNNYYYVESITASPIKESIGKRRTFVSRPLQMYYFADSGYLQTNSIGFLIGEFDLSYVNSPYLYNDLVGGYASGVYFNYLRCPTKAPVLQIGYNRNIGSTFLIQYAYDYISNTYLPVNTANQNSLGFTKYNPGSFLASFDCVSNFIYFADDEFQIWVGQATNSASTINWYPICKREQMRSQNLSIIMYRNVVLTSSLGNGVYGLSSQINVATSTALP